MIHYDMYTASDSLPFRPFINTPESMLSRNSKFSKALFILHHQRFWVKKILLTSYISGLDIIVSHISYETCDMDIWFTCLTILFMSHECVKICLKK